MAAGGDSGRARVGGPSRSGGSRSGGSRPGPRRRPRSVRPATSSGASTGRQQRERAGSNRTPAQAAREDGGLSSTRRAVVLAVVVCALALTVAMPLRSFLSQRAELADLRAERRALAEQVDELSRRRAELMDPAVIETEARRRLGYVYPGEVPYVVQSPAVPEQPAPSAGPAESPWFSRLWAEVRGPGAGEPGAGGPGAGESGARR